MFSGLISAQGTIAHIQTTHRRCVVRIITPPSFLRAIKKGDSIAVDGVCLTVVQFGKQWFTIELMPVTIALTRFQSAQKGDRVNCERSLKIGDRLEGHMVMGHVDGRGVIRAVIKQRDVLLIAIRVPSDVKRYIVARGAIAVNGVSLTIVKKTKGDMVVSLTNTTQQKTNLGTLRVGDRVNLEIDYYARYICS